MINPKNRVLNLFNSHSTYLAVLIVLIIIIFAICIPRFFTYDNLHGILVSYSFMGILALGVLVVLIHGGIDISFMAIMAWSQYLIALYLTKTNNPSIIIMMLIAASIGILLGSINALLVYALKMPSIIITIATLNVFHGILMLLNRGRLFYNFPEWFQNFGLLKVLNLFGPNNTGISIQILIWCVLIIITYYILKHTSLGKKVFAVGGNADAAYKIGINILFIKIFVFSFMGFCAGIAGIMHAVMIQTVATNYVIGRELEVIVAVVLGGASLTGGRGSILGTVLGIFLIALIGNGLTFLKIPTYIHTIILGVIITTSVSFTQIQVKLQESKQGKIYEE